MKVKPMNCKIHGSNHSHVLQIAYHSFYGDFVYMTEIYPPKWHQGIMYPTIDAEICFHAMIQIFHHSFWNFSLIFYVTLSKNERLLWSIEYRPVMVEGDGDKSSFWGLGRSLRPFLTISNIYSAPHPTFPKLKIIFSNWYRQN